MLLEMWKKYSLIRKAKNNKKKKFYVVMCTMKNDAVKRDYIIWYTPRANTIEIIFMRILWNFEIDIFTLELNLQ